MKLRQAAVVVGVIAVLLASPACIHFGRANAFQKTSNPEDYEKLMWESVKTAKWIDVQSHMAETYVGSMPQGVLNRDQMIALWKQMKLESYAMSDVQTKPNGADMVISYDLQLTGTIGGQKIPPGKAHVLTVWQPVKHGWIEVAQSIIPEQPWPTGK